MKCEKSSSKSANPLFWIGIAVLSCLVILTIVTVIDLKNDANTRSTEGNDAAAGILPFSPDMRLSLSRCPACGADGIVQCFYCGGFMRWSPFRHSFFCPACRRSGSPRCPRCGSQMIGVLTNTFQQNI